jgi:hypothetical protein
MIVSKRKFYLTILPWVLTQFLFVSDVHSFGTINSHGQNAEHGKITRKALACEEGQYNSSCFEPKTLKSISGASKRFGAVGYPDLPGAIEWPPGHKLNANEAHCSGGDFFETAGDRQPYPQTASDAQNKLEACRDRARKLFELAVEDAAGLVSEDEEILGPIPNFGSFKGCEERPPKWPKCKVLFSFGILLHATQDFYAHSNWVDVAEGPLSADNPPGLANAKRAEWLDLQKNHPFPKGLISGCYLGEPEDSHCKHTEVNSLAEYRVRHKVLNKDRAKSEKDFTENPFYVGVGATLRGSQNNNFARAVLAAIDDTEYQWASLREALLGRYGRARGNKIICVLTRDSPDKSC